MWARVMVMDVPGKGRKERPKWRWMDGSVMWHTNEHEDEWRGVQDSGKTGTGADKWPVKKAQGNKLKSQ